jgi:beta-xylosidase
MRIFIVLLIVSLAFTTTAQQQKTWKLADIPIRDPYILPVEEENTYYLYSATHGNLRDTNGNQGVCAYKSDDLKLWEGPYIVFEYPDGFWADPNHGIWAPEVHKYKGKYYLFATFSNPGDTIEIRKDQIPVILRATQILVSENPMGPFKPFDLNKPTTPDHWSALDGTLWEEEGKPYMIFCHEWVQINEGTFERVELKPDLSGFAGNPVTIFKANDAWWVKRMDLLDIKYKGQPIPGYVSDGPDIHRLPSGRLICLTSGFGENGYSLSYAISESGKLTGPWKHPENPLLTGGHGHGTLFRTFSEKLALTCHYPNTSPSKAVIYEVEELEKGIRIKDRLD